MSTTDPTAAALEWIAADPDSATRAELQGLVDAGADDELTERMAGTLEFGTAGLRGRVEAGSNRMNRAVVIRTTRGLANYLRETTGVGGTVVVGRDARLSSEIFMEDTISVLLAAGFDVRYFRDPTPTPLVAYAGRRLG
ncbi:MAG: phospho-sugar mutase, partial [Actinomycetota bacterium]|nr:phospho-sugar mutase [Actinomycetota bacterium]